MKHKYRKITDNIGWIFAIFVTQTDDMLNYIREYCRKKYIAQFASRKDSSFINLKNISSAGFLYAVRSKESIAELLEIHKFFNNKGLKFSGLVVEIEKNVFDRESSDKKQAPRLVFPSELEMCKELTIVPFEKLSWLGILDKFIAEKFFAAEFDLFINLNDDSNFTLDYLFAHYVKSPMRVGMVNDHKLSYNVVVQGRDKEVLPVLPYLEQVFYYLDLIKTK